MEPDGVKYTALLNKDSLGMLGFSQNNGEKLMLKCQRRKSHKSIINRHS
jgi:hypothetical protein